MKSIFISASIQDSVVTDEEGLAPINKHDIREALIACTEILSRYYELIWGGHPAITALILAVQSEFNPGNRSYRIFQSQCFPPCEHQENVVYTPKKESPEASLTHMRESMLSPDIEYALGIFMGGKTQGLSEEIDLFQKNHPNAHILVLPGTGGYARHIFEHHVTYDITQRRRLNERSIYIPKMLHDCCARGRYHRLFSETKEMLSNLYAQSKCFISGNGVEVIEKHFRNQRILPLPQLEWYTETCDAAVQNRQGKNMLQMSFIITNRSGKILTTYRDNSYGQRISSGTSLLFSTNPSRVVRLCHTYDEALENFYKKIPKRALNDIPELTFLGMVKNVITKEGYTSPFTYYFYVFEARLNQTEELDTTNVNQIRKIDGKSASNDKVCLFESFDKVVQDIDQWKMNADKAALLLLAKQRGIIIEKDMGNARYLEAQKQHPFEDVNACYFISHASSDYKNTVLPVLKVLDAAHIPYWVHEKHVRQNATWSRSNLTILPKCKGVISIETKSFIKRKHVQEEARQAMQTREKFKGDFPIYRLFCTPMKNSTVHPWLKTGDSDLIDFVDMAGIPVEVTNEDSIRAALRDVI